MPPAPVPSSSRPCTAGRSTCLPGRQRLTHVTQQGETLLPHWAGGLLFAGYGLALAAAGTRLALRRDIT
jgi:hypothetical protein